MNFANGEILEMRLRLIACAVEFGGPLPVAACWQPGISRAACATAEIAGRKGGDQPPP